MQVRLLFCQFNRFTSKSISSCVIVIVCHDTFRLYVIIGLIQVVYRSNTVSQKHIYFLPLLSHVLQPSLLMLPTRHINLLYFFACHETTKSVCAISLSLSICMPFVIWDNILSQIICQSLITSNLFYLGSIHNPRNTNLLGCLVKRPQ
jgi:hypothetical protein